MKPFVKATYALEGDGPLALAAYQQLSALCNHVSSQYHPDLVAVVKHSLREILHTRVN